MAILRGCPLVTLNEDIRRQVKGAVDLGTLGDLHHVLVRP
jgi:hypothetical protein